MSNHKKQTVSFKVERRHRRSVQQLVRKFLRNKGYKLYNKNGKARKKDRLQ